MLLTKVLIAGAIAMYVVIRIAPSLAAKGGAGKRAQLWMLGEPRTAKAPHRDDVVM
jgi:hypothetical protein